MVGFSSLQYDHVLTHRARFSPSEAAKGHIQFASLPRDIVEFIIHYSLFRLRPDRIVRSVIRRLRASEHLEHCAWLAADHLWGHISTHNILPRYLSFVCMCVGRGGGSLVSHCSRYLFILLPIFPLFYSLDVCNSHLGMLSGNKPTSICCFLLFNPPPPPPFFRPPFRAGERGEGWAFPAG